MKAIICTGYGGPEVLQLREIDTPTPKENEILIEIKATSVTTAGCIMRTGKPYLGRLFLGLTKPKNAIPGTDLAGEVVKVGKTVTKFKVGDLVIAETSISCSTYAEYICLPEDEIIVKQPQNISPENATGILDGGSTALAFFTDSVTIKKGQKILINGASGSIGTAAIQLAKHFGAEVTGVCSTKNIELVKSLGADHVIDYTKSSLDKTNKVYDIIFDTVGKLSFKKNKQSLKKNGVFLTPVLNIKVLVQMLFNNLLNNKKLKFAATGLRKPELRLRDLKAIVGFMKAGVLTTVIDRTYRLDQVQEAHAYVDKGHKRGNVIISLT